MDFSTEPSFFETGAPRSGHVASQQVGGGRYTLIKQIGRGGMGIVWLARDESLGEMVALKFLPPMIAADPAALDDLRRETARSRRLTHPNIIRIHEVWELKGEEAFISMEFVDGPNLSVLRVQQPHRVLAWPFLEPLVKQLCDALAHAHGEMIIHRDLKPANLMLDHKGRLKLADFGIAAVVSDSVTRLSAKKNSGGTLAYMSPQQMDGETPNTTDDIYSLGASLYELLVSKPPFFSGDILHQARNVAPKPIEQRLADLGIKNDIPRQAVTTIMACLSKNPAQRPQTAREVASRLGLAGTPIDTEAGIRMGTGATAAPRPRFSLTRIRWNRQTALVSALGVAGLLSLSSWYFVSQRATQASRQRDPGNAGSTQSAQASGRKGSALTAFDLIREGNRFVPERSKGKVVEVLSTKSPDRLMPRSWRVVYFDPEATFKAVEVRFNDGEMVKVKDPGRFLELFKPSAQKPLDQTRLKIDSDEAVRIALREPGMDKPAGKTCEPKLDRGDGGLPVWKIQFWAAHRLKPEIEVKLGEITIAADDGKVLKSQLRPERAEESLPEPVSVRGGRR